MMNKLIMFIAVALFTATPFQSTQASNLIKVISLGSSPKGQFVAFEEFGYKNDQKTPFSKIRVMNMWKNRYVDTPIQVIGNKRNNELEDIRKKAKKMAMEKLKKFNINS